jgi:hypothetical protein
MMISFTQKHNSKGKITCTGNSSVNSEYCINKRLWNVKLLFEVRRPE